MRRSTWCSWPPLGQRPRLPPHNMHVPRIRFSPLSPVAFQSSESFGATESHHPWPVPARQTHLPRKNSLAPPTPSRYKRLSVICSPGVRPAAAIRIYVQEVAGGDPRPISPEGYRTLSRSIAMDDRSLIV